MNNWIDINDRLPEPEEYVLVPFENECITTVDIGTYRVDADENGAFYHCDDDASYATFGAFVNAWMPLPKKYERNRHMKKSDEQLKQEIAEIRRFVDGDSTDKIVQQLASVSFERYGNDGGMGGELVVNLDDAIEIVKAGGKRDK